MGYRAGDPYYSEFTTSNPTTLAAQNADSLPVATANHNGADDSSFVLTVANLDTGRYKVTGTVPSGYGAADVVVITAAATVAGVTGKDVIDSFMVDRPVELPSPPAGYGPGGGSSSTAVTDLAGGSSRNPSVMTVQNSLGQPIEGAIVEAYVASAYAANPATAVALNSTATDVNGHWTLNLPTGSGVCDVIATYAGYQSAMGQLTV